MCIIPGYTGHTLGGTFSTKSTPGEIGQSAFHDYRIFHCGSCYYVGNITDADGPLLSVVGVQVGAVEVAKELHLNGGGDQGDVVSGVLVVEVVQMELQVDGVHAVVRI